MPIRQPFFPGGGSPTAMSPLPATSASDSTILQNGDGGVGGVSLGDAAEIEPHLRFEQPRRMLRRVEFEKPIADRFASRGDRIARRQLARPPRPPP